MSCVCGVERSGRWIRVPVPARRRRVSPLLYTSKPETTRGFEALPCEIKSRQRKPLLRSLSGPRAGLPADGPSSQ